MKPIRFFNNFLSRVRFGRDKQNEVQRSGKIGFIKNNKRRKRLWQLGLRKKTLVPEHLVPE